MIRPERLAFVLAALAALAPASTAAGATPQPLDLKAKSASDAFVHALVVKHDLGGARAFTTARFGVELRRLNAGLVRDGVNTVLGQSRILRGCQLLPTVGKPSSRGDCVFYRLRGRRRVSGHEQVSDGRFKVWLRRETGRWKVWAYEYSATVEDCPDKCRD